MFRNACNLGIGRHGPYSTQQRQTRRQTSGDTAEHVTATYVPAVAAPSTGAAPLPPAQASAGAAARREASWGARGAGGRVSARCAWPSRGASRRMYGNTPEMRDLSFFFFSAVSSRALCRPRTHAPVANWQAPWYMFWSTRILLPSSFTGLPVTSQLLTAVCWSVHSVGCHGTPPLLC